MWWCPRGWKDMQPLKVAFTKSWIYTSRRKKKKKNSGFWNCWTQHFSGLGVCDDFVQASRGLLALCGWLDLRTPGSKGGICDAFRKECFSECLWYMCLLTSMSSPSSSHTGATESVSKTLATQHGGKCHKNPGRRPICCLEQPRQHLSHFIISTEHKVMLAHLGLTIISFLIN